MFFEKVFEEDFSVPVGKVFRLSQKMGEGADFWGIKNSNGVGPCLNFFHASKVTSGSFFQEGDWKLFRLEQDALILLNPKGSLFDKTHDGFESSNAVDLIRQYPDTWCQYCKEKSRKKEVMCGSGGPKMEYVCVHLYCPSRLGAALVL